MWLKISNKAIFFISVSQFGMTFAFGFVMTFMPFYITQISTLGPKETMIWIGMIMGPSYILTALTAPFWGGLTSKFSPKFLFERGMLCNGILFLLMGFTSNLYLLFLLRIIQGTLGGVSTIGLILISAISPEEQLHRNLSLYQNSITTGQLIGPLLGAYSASVFGYRFAFVFSFVIASIFLIFCHKYVSKIPLQKKESYADIPFKRGLVWGWGLIFIATLHLTFLPSILPKILEGFHLEGRMALKSAGFIIMSYTVTAILGNYLLSRIASKLGLRKVIAIACILAALLQVLLVLSKGVLSFSLIRMMQTGFIAAIFPLTLSIFARNIGGKTVGFLNSSRFVGMAVGPIMATSILAYSNLLTLYLSIAGLTFCSLWAFMSSIRTRED
jgi:DHA1 family multidrug resistance protein-like MFS transporter